MPLHNLVSNLALKACFKNLIPWEKKFHLQNRLTWISIEGLPPHAWHEAAFTHIAGTWGEVAGKVCIRTKCMEVIQHNMLVVIDEVHFCVRIKEIMGECDEKTIVSKSDEDYSSSNDDSSGKEVVHSEEDDDDFYDDGSDYNFFTDEVNEIQGGGGWIRNDVGDTKDISSPQSSKSDNIQNGMLPENSNIQVENEIQISPLSGGCNMDPLMHTVPDTYIEEKSPCAQGILDKHAPDSLEKSPNLHPHFVRMLLVLIGSLLGFNLVGKEDMVRKTIGDSFVTSLHQRWRCKVFSGIGK
ncbi:hypothetical protein Tco_1422684 [Tanacetum coccineum]